MRTVTVEPSALLAVPLMVWLVFTSATLSALSPNSEVMATAGGVLLITLTLLLPLATLP
ncbi:putative membrane protein [Duffyella gerundensis]|uniref:Putative membrane protein n=1 Tax=Duffyella gerundensis TaxID=1619313 RepID=A0A0U5L883_9GAMM|nr:putative membrane protein [Duffyella gerundensis]